MRHFSFSSLLIGAAFLAATTALAFPQQTNALAASSLTQITGISTNDYVGSHVATGDFNGDGYDDILVGAYNALTGATRNGAAYLIYGSATPLSAQSLSASNVVTFTGEMEYSYAGYAVASAGDVDNDGYDDILIGSPQQSTTGVLDVAEGAVYLIYGSATQHTSASLSTAVKIAGTQALQYFGLGLNGIGDVDADGYDDFAIGSPLLDNSGANKGATYLFYGSGTRYTSGNVSTLGIRLLGATAGDGLGESMNSAGDLNADGYGDWMTGAYGEDTGANNAGAMYVMYGSGTRLTAGSISGQIQLRGEAANNQIGYFSAHAGDLNADGYSDALIGTPYAGTSAGSTYIIYGSATLLTSQSLSFAPKLSGLTTAQGSGYIWDSNQTINVDGYSDFVIGAPNHVEGSSENIGMAYLFLGQAAQFTNGGVNTASTTSFLGEAAQDQFGSITLLADLNGDGLGEVIIGASQNDDGASGGGAIYIGYLRIDVDEDGVLASTGLLEQGTDCNDSDATVSANQTYYLDEDDDGLGVTETTTSVCSSTAPEGYANNDDDTDDAVVNNGVEIGGDGIDNDGDGEIDEDNTVEDNETHPGYENEDPTDEDAVTAGIVSVSSTQTGQLKVTYADDSVYLYTVFSTTQKKLKLIQYNDTAYYVAMTSNGRKLGLVNAFNGEVVMTTSFKGRVFLKHDLQLSDLRDDGITDVVIASKKGKRVRVAIAGVNFSKNAFVHKAKKEVNAAAAQLSKTTIVDNTIDIRSKKAQLVSLFVTKKHKLVVLK